MQTEQQKLETIHKFITEPSLATAESLIDLNDKLDTQQADTITAIDEVKQAIQSIEIPEQKDHTSHMEKMMEMIQEPMDITVTLNIK